MHLCWLWRKTTCIHPLTCCPGSSSPTTPIVRHSALLVIYKLPLVLWISSTPHIWLSPPRLHFDSCNNLLWPSRKRSLSTVYISISPYCNSRRARVNNVSFIGSDKHPDKKDVLCESLYRMLTLNLFIVIVNKTKEILNIPPWNVFL